MDLKTKDSFDFKSERRSGKLFKRIISGITAAAMAAGLLTTSAFADEEVTYEHPSDINSVVDIMKNYAFIGFNEVDMNGHQHINLLVNKVVGLPGDMGIRKNYAGVYEYYVNKLPENISGELKIGENDPCVSNLTLGSDYTISTNGSERYIEPNHVKVSPSVTNIKAETATNKYIDLVNLQNSFISYSAMLAENADSTEGFGLEGQYDSSSNTWQNINRINVTAESGTVFYNIDDTNFSKINSDAIINFSDTSTASIVLNIDLKNISWDRKPFRLNIGGNQPTMNEDVILENNVNRIYYNFYDSSAADKMTTKTVSMTDAAHGTIIIPKGAAKVGSNWCGVIVANNIGATGESHFVGAYNPVVPTSATVDVTVNKVWSEPSGQSHDGYYVKVDLMRSSAAETAHAIDNAILDSSNNFEYTFTGLKEKDADGNTYTYTVANEVTDAPEYIDGVQSGYEVSYNGTTVTNTWKEATIPAPKTDITVNKVWAGEPSSQSHDSYYVKVDLMRSSAAEPARAIDTATLDASNNFEYTFTGLDEQDANGNPYTYTVANEITDAPKYTENVQSGYEATYSGTTVTNTWKDTTTPTPTPTTIDVRVNKVWDNEPIGQSHDSYTVTVELLRKVNETIDSDFSETITLTFADNFTKTINDLAAEDADGNAYTYYVENEHTNAPKYIDGVQSGYEATYNGTTVTNTWKDTTTPTPTPGTTDITVKKIWAGELAGYSHDSYTVTVELLRKANGTVDPHFSEPITLNAANGFEYISGLEAEDADGNPYTYYIENESTNAPQYMVGVQSGYKATYSGTTVTNTWTELNTPTPSKISVTVNKTWANEPANADHSNYVVKVDLIRNSVTVTDQKVATVTLEAANNFTATVDDLKEFDASGNIFVYTVANEQMIGMPEYIRGVQSGYTASYNGTTVTNTWNEVPRPAPVTTSVTVTKLWSGDEGRNDHSGYEVAVQLVGTANGVSVVVENVVLNAQNNFTKTIDNLDKYDGNGNLYTYSIRNEASTAPKFIAGVQSGYEVSISGTTVTNTWHEVSTVSGNHSFKFKKTDREGVALENSEFTLYYDASCTSPVMTDAGDAYKVRSDKDGIVEFKGLIPGTYYFAETEAPKGYKLNTNIYSVTITVDADGNTVVTFGDGTSIGLTSLAVVNDPISTTPNNGGGFNDGGNNGGNGGNNNGGTNGGNGKKGGTTAAKAAYGTNGGDAAHGRDLLHVGIHLLVARRGKHAPASEARLVPLVAAQDFECGRE